mmetsp:Transcript_12219/g.18228  ORF Transcript_12219/g.18228 Transcript_12219/m.18228 type:complete len:80 (+) Transcript_12219:148-387(+)
MHSLDHRDYFNLQSESTSLEQDTSLLSERYESLHASTADSLPAAFLGRFIIASICGAFATTLPTITSNSGSLARLCLIC